MTGQFSTCLYIFHMSLDFSTIFMQIIYTSLHAQISSIRYMSLQFSNPLLSCLYISPQSFTILYMSHVSCMSRQFSTCLYNSRHFLKFLVQLQRSVCPQSAAVGSNGSTVNQQTVYTTVSLKYGCSRSGISLQISTILDMYLDFFIQSLQALAFHYNSLSLQFSVITLQFSTFLYHSLHVSASLHSLESFTFVHNLSISLQFPTVLWGIQFFTCTCRNNSLLYIPLPFSAPLHSL